VIERAAILGHGKRLEVAAALGADGRRSVAASPTYGAAPTSVPVLPRPTLLGASATLGTSAAARTSSVARLDEAMVRHIETALAQTGGRIEGPRGAAALLAINPHTLRARMRKLGIDWSRFRDGGALP